VFGSTKHFRIGQFELGKSLLSFAKPIFDPRELVVSGLHLLCPYLEVNRLVILGRFFAFFVVVDAAIVSYGRRILVRQKYCEAVF